MWTEPFEIIGLAVWTMFVAIVKTIIMAIILFTIIFIIYPIKFLFWIGVLLASWGR